jgi:phage terminase large subunit
VTFSRHFLRHDVWATSAHILRSVRDNPRTAVKACHASSKTFTAAEVVLWWFTIYPDGIVLTTAPTWTQVKRVLWGEVRKAADSGRIKFPHIYATELRDDDDPNNYAVGLSTNEGVRFQGYHGRVLIIFDEAPGVHADIWEAVEGIRAGGDVRWLVLGNPVEIGGPFYELFTSARSGWVTFTIDGLDTPNTWGLGGSPEARLAAIVDAGRRGDTALLNHNPRPYLISRGYIWEKYEEWGTDDPRWQSRVRGQFPDTSESAVFPLAWLEQASARRRVVRSPRTPAEGRLRAGIDVAGPGEDETVCYVLDYWNEVVGFRAWPERDARGKALAYLNELGGPDRFEVVHVDSNGIGWYFTRHLADHGYHVNDVNVGLPANDDDRFYLVKAELYWRGRELLQAGGFAGLSDPTTISQLSTVKWTQDARSRIVIMSKDKMRAEGLKSPDRAEALILAAAPVPPPGGLVRAPTVSRGFSARR